MNYDYVHFFLIDSGVFNVATQEMIEKYDAHNRHLFVYAYKNFSYSSDNTIYDSSILNIANIDRYLLKSKYLVIHGLVYKPLEILKIKKYSREEDDLVCMGE